MTRILAVCLFLLPASVALSAVPDITYAPALEKELKTALANQPKSYKPRTQHLCNNDKPCFTNRLILEKSPYLRQHAHNPVNWYAWSEEALQAARRQNKPVFLSIGYSTCHWCHVMEKESFDDLEVASILNKHFIAIKVDREQRPDIDELYGYVPVITGKLTGWPTTILLKANGDAFYGGVYYPKQELVSLLTRIRHTWETDMDAINRQAKSIMASLKALSLPTQTKDVIDAKTVETAVAEIASAYDMLNAGFGEANKFPNESWLLFLLQVFPDSKHTNDLSLILKSTLDAMANGAIHDHLGGGFHRYAVDPQWTEPHYEKMLYNQALLIRIYLQAYTLFNRQEYLLLAMETADFVLRDMKDKNGMFWSAMDADSGDTGHGEAQEGAYYVWQPEKIKALLTDEQYEIFKSVYVTHEHVSPLNTTLYRKKTVAGLAGSMGLKVHDLRQELNEINKKLLSVRSTRVAPAVDKKQILSWNGMMTGSLAMIADVTASDRYREAATRAADTIWSNMKSGNGFKRIIFRDEIHTPAQLEDYAWYLDALTRLYDMDGDSKWLRHAEFVVNGIQQHFIDRKHGGFFHTRKQADRSGGISIRAKSAIDRSIPAANAITTLSLLRLARQTGKREYKKQALDAIVTFSADAKQAASAHASLLVALLHKEKQDAFHTGYVAKGKIAVRASYRKLRDNQYVLSASLYIRDGWHINSNKPLEEYLVPTTLKLSDSNINKAWQIEKVDFPDAKQRVLGFNSNPLSLYEGNISITANLTNRSVVEYSPLLKLQLQACNDNSCLPPENIEILAWPADAKEQLAARR